MTERSRPYHRSRTSLRKEARMDAAQASPNARITSFFYPINSPFSSPTASAPPAFSSSSSSPSPFSSAAGRPQSAPPQSAGARRPPEPPHYPPGQRQALRAVAQDTLAALPELLQELGTADVARTAAKFTWDTLPRLDPRACPGFLYPATVRVVPADTLNAAIQLLGRPPPAGGGGFNGGGGSSGAPPLVVNFANRHSPGGGWRNGAMAQEEALCYRSSLSLSLRRRHYPLATNEVLYSPYVLVMRADHPSGHAPLSPAVPPQSLPVVSVISVAALRDPGVRSLTDGHGHGHGHSQDHDRSRSQSRSRSRSRTRSVVSGASSSSSSHPPDADEPPSPAGPTTRLVFERDYDRAITKSKMRLTLRAAATHGHDQLVLGALGCGVFRNPPEDVAHCWLEVLHEDEFAGHWWRDVVFAVYDGHPDSHHGGAPPRDSTSNYGIFHRVLDGQRV